MISTRWKRWLKETSHPSREDLLAHFDGELGARRARIVRQHLEQCWTCRQKTERVSKTVGAFVEYRQLRCDLAENLPPRQWTNFQFLLAQASRRRSGSQPRLFSALRWTHAAVAAACVLAALVVWMRLASVTTVSAKEILARVDAAERREGPESGRPLLRQTLRVVRRSARGGVQAAQSVVVWQDLAAGEPRAAGEGQSPASIDILPSPWRREPLLSAAAFDRWRRSLVSRREDVRTIDLPGGRPGFLIEVRDLGLGLKDGIVENTLVVRSDVWRPVSQQVRVRSGGEELLFEVVRESYAFLSREKPLPPVRTAGANSRLAAPAAFPEPREAPDSQADEPGLVRAEVEVRFALHRLNACVDDSIEAAAESGAVVVRGATATNERRNEIAAALARIGAVRFEVEAAEVVAARMRAMETAEIPGQEAPAERVASVKLPVRDRLVSYFRRERPESDLAHAVAGVANSAVTASSAAVAHAGALKRLADRFSEADVSRMEPASCWLLETMARSHLEQLREARRQVAEIVSPLLDRPSLGATGGAQQPSAGWRMESVEMFENSRAVDSLIRQLFAPSVALDQPVDPALDRLWTLLAGAESRFTQIETGLAAELSGIQTAGKDRPPPRPFAKE